MRQHGRQQLGVAETSWTDVGRPGWRWAVGVQQLPASKEQEKRVAEGQASLASAMETGPALHRDAG